MSFRELSNRYLEPGSMWLMVLGIVALCQPWILLLHAYGVTITLIGLVGFSIFSKGKPAEDEGARDEAHWTEGRDEERWSDGTGGPHPHPDPPLEGEGSRAPR